MNPTLSLGPWEAPALEIAHNDLYQILGVLIEKEGPLESGDWDSVVTLLQIDGLYLRKDTESFFSLLAGTCRHIANGETKRYDPAWMEHPDIRFYVRSFSNDGVVTSGARAAAQCFIDFLDQYPNHWPARTIDEDRR